MAVPRQPPAVTEPRDVRDGAAATSHPPPTAELLAAAADDTRLTRSELTQPDELRVQVQLVAVLADQSEGLWGGWVVAEPGILADRK